MNEKQLNALTAWLKDNIFRNTDIMFDNAIWNQELENLGCCCDMIDIIATLHNLLYEEVTGERYNYMFHWANKIGGDCIDDAFDTLLLNAEEKENE